MAIHNKWTDERVREYFLSVKLLPIEPVSVGRTLRRKWRCKCLICYQLTERSVDSLLVTKTKIGCQKCTGKARSQKLKFDENKAIQFMKELSLSPLVPYPGSQVVWNAKCDKCGRKVNRTFRELRTSFKKWNTSVGCTYCNGNKVVPDEMDALLDQFGLIPVESYINNEVSRLFRCARCGNETRQSYINIRRKFRTGALSYGCPDCSFKEMGRRKSEDSEVVRARFLEVGLILEGEYTNARKYVECKCIKCNSKTKQSLNGVNNGKTCKFCSPKGIQLGQPAYIYLVSQPMLNALKVGIGNSKNKNDRLKIHSRSGWEVIGRWDLDSGHLAEKSEALFFKWLRIEKNLPVYLTYKEMPQGGWSETFTNDAIPMSEIICKIEEFNKFVCAE